MQKKAKFNAEESRQIARARSKLPSVRVQTGNGGCRNKRLVRLNCCSTFQGHSFIYLSLHNKVISHQAFLQPQHSAIRWDTEFGKIRMGYYWKVSSDPTQTKKLINLSISGLNLNKLNSDPRKEAVTGLAGVHLKLQWVNLLLLEFEAETIE